MKEALRQFMVLMQENPDLVKQMEQAVKTYQGDHSEEALFENIITPIAAKAGYTIDYQSLKESFEAMDPEEMAQVAGGTALDFPCSCFGTGGGNGTGSCVLLGDGPGSIFCFTFGSYTKLPESHDMEL